MPTYTFFNKRTRKEFTEMMSISEMEEYLLEELENEMLSEVGLN